MFAIGHHKYWKCITLLYLVLYSLTAGAQQHYLAGVCTDTTGKPIPYANIRLAANSVVGRAGAQGAFGLLSSKSADTAWFYLEGYDTAKVILKAGNANTVVLRASQERLALLRERTRLSSLTPNLVKAEDFAHYNQGETYAELFFNPFLNTRQYPVTGFSPNSNSASYSNIRRMLNNNTRVPPNAVRVEEMLNYFALRCASPPLGGQTFSMETRVTDCPWDSSRLLLIGNALARKIDLKDIPPANLVFLLDNSGSMDQPNRLPLLKQGFRMLIENLRDTDRVAIVTYGGAAGITLPPTRGYDKQKIWKALDEIEPGGTTPGSNGIQLAYELVTTNPYPQGNNRVILATDGDFNVGISDETELEELIVRYSRTGVYLTCLGVGMGNYKDSKIETLARFGRGNFAYLDTEAEAEKVLVTELTNNLYTIATGVTITYTFNPALVKQYRLMGYDNRKAALADSNSNLLGGDLGSGSSVLSLVEWERAPGTGNAPVTEPTPNLLGQWQLQYQPAHAGTDTVPVTQTHTIHYNYQPLQQLDRGLQFATAVCMAGLMLRGTLPINADNMSRVQLIAANSVNPIFKEQQAFLQLLNRIQQLYLPEPATKKGKRQKQ